MVSDPGMAVTSSTPDVNALGDVVQALREWQDDAAPIQLHPGDVGWFWQFGAEATAAALRTWSRDGRIVAVGLLDGPDLVRLTTAPEAMRDEELAQQIVEDVSDPERGVLPAGRVAVEAPPGALVLEPAVGGRLAGRRAVDAAAPRPHRAGRVIRACGSR